MMGGDYTVYRVVFSVRNSTAMLGAANNLGLTL
jgi:hypothetical protein